MSVMKAVVVSDKVPTPKESTVGSAWPPSFLWGFGDVLRIREGESAVWGTAPFHRLSVLISLMTPSPDKLLFQNLLPREPAEPVKTPI